MINIMLFFNCGKHLVLSDGSMAMEKNKAGKADGNGDEGNILKQSLGRHL